MKSKKDCVILAVYTTVISAVFALTHLTNAVTTAVIHNIPLERNHTIIIDAGHGGEDGGATSVSGIPESKFNLEIALRLQDCLRLLGYQTKMIRTTDQSVYTEGTSIAQKKVSDLKERVRIVNDTENAILISIHQNYFADGRYSGAQVFYGAKGESKDLAVTLQSCFRDTLNPKSKRDAKKSEGIYLMEHIDCTGVLVECGFLSNYAEEAALRSGEYQKKICCVIAFALGSFLTK